MAAEEGRAGITELAARLPATKDAVRRWAGAKGFSARRVERLLRFRLLAVDEWMKAGGDDSESSSSGNTVKNETH